MSSMRYSEICPEYSSSNFTRSSRRGLRKMSCFDVRCCDDQQSRYTKKSFSTNSLPRPPKNTELFEVIRLPPSDVASQLTLIDFELFAKIQLDELVSCGWIKKNKHQVAPNIVAFTRRFNHVSFWVVEEILKRESCGGRAEVISYFIKLSKHLYEVNNLHSLFAIVSALRSASIYRLSNTWLLLSKKDKHYLEKYVDLFSDKDNWAKLRAELNSLKIPCVPYIGIYLTDLVYLNMANPNCFLEDILPANNIFRIITTYQSESNYYSLPRDYPLQAQLKSIKYIDELLKFVEDYNYNMSLKLEPPSEESPPKNTWLKCLWLKYREKK